MSYPRSFYFIEKLDGDYSRIPQGTVVVNRFIRNQAAWKRMSLTSSLKPKSLVLADWTAENWSDERINTIKEKISRLINDGFKLYYWQDGQVKTLTKEEISHLDKIFIRRRMTPAFPEVVKQSAVNQHGLIPSQVHVLDVYGLQQLLDDDEHAQTNRLLVTKFTKSSHGESLVTILNQGSAKLEELIIDEFAEDTNAIVEQLPTLLPQVPMRVQYSCLSLNPKQVEELLSKNKSVTLSGATFNLSQLQDIESMTLEDGSSLEQLLTESTKLKKLSLASCVNLSEHINAHRTLKHLQELKISDGSYLTPANIQSLLLKSKSLKRLDLTSCSLLANDSLSALGLEKLETLSIQKTAISTANLSSLLAKAKNLKTLQLTNCTHLTDEFLEEFNLENVEVLEINDSDIKARNLYSLLAKATKLKKLYLTKCPHLTDELLEKFNLVNLEELVIQDTKISTNTINCLLANTTKLKKIVLPQPIDSSSIIEEAYQFQCIEELDISNTEVDIYYLEILFDNSLNLKRLNISNCNFSQEDLETGKFLSEHLEELIAIRCHLSIIDLECFLTNAINLKNLNLTSCNYLNDEFSDSLNLPNLKQLTLFQGKISATNFQRLLANTTKLKQLNITDCVFSEALSSNFNLVKLETLDADWCKLTIIDLGHLLTNATSLKTLNLSDCKNLSDNSAVNFNLPNLETLKVDQTNITTPALQNLLVNSIKLKKLNISGCLNLFGEFTVNFNLASLDEIDASFSSLNTQNLKTLLRAAPNLKKLDLTECKAIVIDETLKELLQGIEVEYHSVQRTSADYSPNMTGELDADTRLNPNKEFHVKEYFYPLPAERDPTPAVNNYRLKSFNELQINDRPCTLDNAFRLGNQDDVSLIEVPIVQSDNLLTDGEKLAKEAKESICFWGRKALLLNPEWQALPSLKPNERLSHYQAIPGCSVDIRYSKRDNLYYVRSKDEESKEVNLDFLVQIPRHEPEVTLPISINELVDYYSHFEPGALDLSGIEKPTGFDYLRCMATQKKGACRHRAAAFKEAMKKTHPEVLVRIIPNDCHAFVELFIDGEWVRRDLGGYPAKLTLDKSNRPSFMSQEPQEAPIVMINAGAAKATSVDDPRVRHYQKQLETWKKAESFNESVLGYCQKLTKQSATKKRLVELASSTEVRALHLSLQDYCQKTSRPFFYVNSPDDLICSAAFLAREGDRGMLSKGPGGPLYDFLQSHRDSKPAPVLIVNYDNFDADDIVRFNGLLDDQRFADGTALPTDALVLGLINTNKPDCYQGEDFYSRFDSAEICLLHSETLKAYEQQIATLPVMELNQLGSDTKTYPINLFHGSDWQERLLGHWEIKKDGLYFVDGELAEALASGLPLELQNAPWNDEAFALFWQQASLRGGFVQEGEILPWPKDLQLIRSDGYDWSVLTETVQWQVGFSKGAKVLNPGCFSDFFNRYHCDNEQETLDTLPGFIKAHANQNLAVNLTQELSLDEWARLLAHCQQQQVRLTVHCSPAVTLPKEVLQGRDLLPAKEPTQPSPSHTKLIISSDSDTTVSQLTANDKDWQIIEVSECGGDDLLIHTDSVLEQDSGRMRFRQSEQALLTALAANKKVILKGSFSQELVDSLAPLLLERHYNEKAKGQLILIAEEQESIPYLPTQTHQVRPKEKRVCLLDTYSKEEIRTLDKSLVEQESLSQLKARLNFARIHPGLPTEKAWQGMYYLPGGVSLSPFDAEHAADLAKAFNQRRVDAVNQVLAHSPCVCLTGITGTGKSSLIEKNFNDDENALYLGEEQMALWAEDSSSKRKILFIDEANLSPKRWSEFEGLFNTPPGILIKGKYYPLTDQHKVIFASNPLNYGDERKLAPFFIRHGSALIIEPLSQEFIYEDVLKPVFEDTPLQEHTLDLCRPFLNVYAFLCQCSDKEVLISPRELQMMALLTLSHYQQHPDTQDALLAANHYAYQLAENLVPQQHRAEFNRQFKPKTAWLRSPNDKQNSNFLLTESRQDISQLLEDFLNLSQFKQSANASNRLLSKLAAVRGDTERRTGMYTLVHEDSSTVSTKQFSAAVEFRKKSNEAQSFGGLNCIVLEGSPGTGKSECTLTSLLAQGYQEIHYTKEKKSDQSLPAKGFYRMPVSMAVEDKKELLLRAFQHGHGVVVDEINSSPMMERFLNALLMGKNPLNGQRPEIPGAFLIGTQNPITLAGRRKPSNALARRIITKTFVDYSPAETKAILINQGLDPSEAGLLTLAFELNVERAKQEKLNPAPTFRDLIRLAKELIRAQKGKEKEKEKEKEPDLDVNLKQVFIEQLKHHSKATDSYGSFFAPGKLSPISQAAEKIANFLQTGLPPDDYSSEELDALNNPPLKLLIENMAIAKLLDNSGLESTDKGVQKIQDTSLLDKRKLVY